MSHAFGNKRSGRIVSQASLNADELVEGLHMSKCSGSDTVFIALPLTRFTEVWIECQLTKGLFPPKSLRHRRRHFSGFRLTNGVLCLLKSKVTLTHNLNSKKVVALCKT